MMPQPNIRLYIILSGILLVVFLAVILIPLGRKTAELPAGQTFPTPTSVGVAPSDEHDSSVVETVDFTGVAEKELPPAVLEETSQKQDLRYRTPISFNTFIIDFDYAEDRFVVTLSEPTEQSRQEFNDWKAANYPAIPANQFNFRSN